jgi:hypothetical protein
VERSSELTNGVLGVFSSVGRARPHD